MNSVDSFLSLFQKTNENNIMEPHFLTKVYLESNVIGYDPSKEELKELLFESLGYITGTLEYLPDLEHKAYPDFYLISGEPGKDIHVALEDGLVDGIKAKLEDILELSTGVMKEYFKRYEKYNYLSNPSIISDIEKFFQETHTFDEYAKVSLDHLPSILPLLCSLGNRSISEFAGRNL